MNRSEQYEVREVGGVYVARKRGAPGKVLSTRSANAALQACQKWSWLHRTSKQGDFAYRRATEFDKQEVDSETRRQTKRDAIAAG